MRRREFITGIAGAAAACPFMAGAQQSAMPVVGVVSGQSSDADARNSTAFHKGLKEAGLVEDQNVTVEYHWLAGQYGPLATLMADLVNRQVAVIALRQARRPRSQPRLQHQRSRSSSVWVKTRSSLVLSPALRDPLAM